MLNRDTHIHLFGEIDRWPTKDEMIEILRAAGLSLTVGACSIRVNDCEHFVFQEYGEDFGDPSIDADAGSLVALSNDARRVSAALAAADIRHRFEVYDDGDELVGYLHHRWPR